MTYPRITEGIRALTNPADHALLDACDSVDATHASLEDENERLRSELDSVGTAAYLYGRSDLNVENAKLRELLKFAAFVLMAIESTTSWRFKGDGKTFDSSYFYSKLRELGVEVDE